MASIATILGKEVSEEMPEDSAAVAAKLWEAFAAHKSLELRNQIVMHYVHLVKYIVLRMAPTYRKHVEFDDLMSSGTIGLMDAVDKFDAAKDVKFETYASLRIRGEIIDQIRRLDWAPGSLRQKIKKIEDGFDSLETKYGRVPTEQEVAAHTAMSADDVKRTLDEAHTFNLVALDEMLMDRVESQRIPVSAEETPETKVENDEMKRILAKTIDSLSEKERTVVSLYYFDEMTLKEIGLILGVTESRVSQIHSKALMSLRQKVKKTLGA